ncbi:MAG: YMGG-like glycine zipper-containing protein [Myxococcota bacterium]|nr:YMGG-like glycine zipper-containing protein [Myxococcota bacterium]
MRASMTMVALAAAMLLAHSAAAQGVFVYPQQGQDAQKQAQDQGECAAWAQQQTGFNPNIPPPTGGSYQGGSQGGAMVGGAARGAALGAIGGAIAGDAGKGAAAGAAMGGLFGGMRHNDRRRQADHAQDQQMAQYNAARDTYLRAYGACLGGRGYTVN